MASLQIVPNFSRFLAFPLACVLAGALVGCADTMTRTRTETNTGRILLAEGDAESAAIIFANQVRRSPNNYKAHYHLGEARLASGRSVDAIHSFKTGLEVMPLSLEGHNDQVYRYKFVHALSSALAAHDPEGSHLEQIEQKSKANPTFKLLVAMTHAKSGRPDNAIQSFNEARALDRNNAEIAKQFGLYLESLAQAGPAEQELRRAYRLNTQDEEVAAALRRLGVIPGPAVLSSTELSRPVLPVGPLPEIQLGRQEKADAPRPGAPVQGSPSPAQPGLN